MGSPKRITQRAKGRGIRKSSQERSRHSREAPTATGTIGAPRSRASVTTPGLTTSRGPARAVGHHDHLAAARAARA